ncbi:MAG: FIST N-terminal domain-containing protein [Pseudomonadota bacterium]
MFISASAIIKETFSRLSGRRLGELIVEQLGRCPKACWLFCAPAPGLQDLLLGIREVIGTNTLVGCTTDGEISTAGFSTASAVLAGIFADRIVFSVASVCNLGRDSEVAGRKLAELLPTNVSYVQIFSDGLTGNGSAIARGMGTVLGAHVPIAGGTAGDSGRFEHTMQFLGTKVMTDAVVAIGFSGDFHVGTGVRSGWSPVGTPKRVTRASGNVLYELNGRPALELYDRFLGKHADELPGVGVEYPLSVVDHDGQVNGEDFYLLRAMMSVDRANGSISFSGDISEGALTRISFGDRPSILAGAEQAAQLALDDLPNVRPAMVFFFSCMARKMVLGHRTPEEIEVLRNVFGADIPMIGFYTYGGYSRINRGGPSLLHNEAAILSVIGVP